jgi:predicted nucleic acid-binding protein
VVDEPESERLANWLAAWPDRVSSALLRTEAVRAVRRYGSDAVRQARERLEGVELLQLDRAILDAAADLAIEARTLDAIHLASALAVGPDLGVVVTYDARMIRAASELGIETIAP